MQMNWESHLTTLGQMHLQKYKASGMVKPDPDQEPESRP